MKSSFGQDLDWRAIYCEASGIGVYQLAFDWHASLLGIVVRPNR